MPDNDQNKDLVLPLSVAQPVDVGRLIRELGLIDEHLNQEAIRSPKKQITVKASTKLDDLLGANNIDVTDKAQRNQLIAYLSELKTSAPTVNLSFSAEADENFIQKIAEWFRREVDARCLIIVGLEPSIGIGSIVRTTNKVFDLSLKNRLKASRDLLVKELESISAKDSP